MSQLLLTPAVDLRCDSAINSKVFWGFHQLLSKDIETQDTSSLSARRQRISKMTQRQSWFHVNRTPNLEQKRSSAMIYLNILQTCYIISSPVQFLIGSVEDTAAGKFHDFVYIH